MSSSQPAAPRLTPRQASAQAQRRARNERRQALSSRIRKQKKSDWLAQKRGIHNNSGATTTTIDLGPTIAGFLQQQQSPPTPEVLQQLQVALQSASLSATPWTLDDPARLSLAKQLVQRMGHWLQHAVTTGDLKGALGTVLVLLQMVSMSTPSKQEDYYGSSPRTWSEILLEFNISSILPTLLNTSAPESLQLAEQTCWFIGNWTLDVPSAARPLRELHLPKVLVQLIQHHLEQSNLVLVQAATWAFCNLLKGDVTASGWEYGFPQELAHRLLTLSVPVIQNDVALERACIDISVSAAWILVHLSQREEVVLYALLNTNNSNIDLIRDVLERLHQVSQGAQLQQQPTQNYFHHGLVEPCMEVLGHWATGCNGLYVPRLLSSTPATPRVPVELSLLPLLQQLLQWGREGRLQVNDYLQAVWLSGCLLCDAPTPNHPSTTLAAPALIPLLTMALQDNGTTRTNSLDCKREALLALWNALDAPPDDGSEIGEGEMASREGFRQLLHLVLTADSNTNGSYNTIRALKTLLLCPDIDALLAALRILNAILREIPTTRVTFQEVEGVEALETVCDLPLGNDPAGNEAADLAAELIDDFFQDDSPEDQFADPFLQPATAGGTFVFGLQTTAPAPAPIFLPDLQPDGSGGSSFLAPVGNPVATASVGMGRGRGRGRGHSLPAWAAQQQVRR